MSCNLLLVEDNPLSRRNLAMFLQQAEFTVHQTDNGEAALELISRVDFDIVISDFRLPGKVNGLDVLKYQIVGVRENVSFSLLRSVPSKLKQKPQR